MVEICDIKIYKSGDQVDIIKGGILIKGALHDKKPANKIEKINGHNRQYSIVTDNSEQQLKREKPQIREQDVECFDVEGCKYRGIQYIAPEYQAATEDTQKCYYAHDDDHVVFMHFNDELNKLKFV